MKKFTARRLGRIAEWAIVVICLVPVAASRARAQSAAPCPPGSKSCPTTPPAPRPPLAKVDGPTQPWAAVVRITVVGDGGSRAIGTGTIIDGTRGAGRVITCAHIFARGATDASLETFDGAPRGGRLKRVATYRGRRVALDAARDVAVIDFEPDTDLHAAPLVERGYEPPRGLVCITLGCDDAAAPSAWTTVLLGEASVVGSGHRWLVGDRASKPGRSGGGLFRASDGALVGVCDFGTMAATGGVQIDDAAEGPDNGLGRGYYAHPESLFAVLATAATAAPAPAPAPAPPANTPPPRESPAAAGFAPDLGHAALVTALVLTVLGFKARALALARSVRIVRTADLTAPAGLGANAGDPTATLAALLPQLRAAVATRAEADARETEDKATAAQILALIRPTDAAPAAAA